MASDPFYKIVGGRPTIDIGSMRHPIIIQANGPTTPPTYDSTGPVFTPTTFTTAMAKIRAVRGRDVILSGQTATQLFLEVGLWWQPGILPNMQVLTELGSQYVIQSVENVLEMNVILILNCIGIGVTGV